MRSEKLGVAIRTPLHGVGADLRVGPSLSHVFVVISRISIEGGDAIIESASGFVFTQRRKDSQSFFPTDSTDLHRFICVYPCHPWAILISEE